MTCYIQLSIQRKTALEYTLTIAKRECWTVCLKGHCIKNTVRNLKKQPLTKNVQQLTTKVSEKANSDVLTVNC
jgi:hypothetical protein